MSAAPRFTPQTRHEPAAETMSTLELATEGDNHLIGREREQAELGRAIAHARQGRGTFLLLAGEAGVGKTRLAQETLAGGDLLVVTGTAIQGTTPPYGPITAALRAYLRIVPDGLTHCGPLTPHLALLLPELGPAPSAVDRATLFEAIRYAFEAIASRQPTAVFLDDLQWADSTTLELLPVLAGTLDRVPLLILGTYRNDEIPRGHPLRRMRTDLRRAGRLHDLAVEPLGRRETAAFAAQVLDAPPDPTLTSILYDRTQGVPFFIEELASALAASGRLRPATGEVRLAVGEDVPIPDTVRDAVLLHVEGLSDKARRALEVAAVAGSAFDLGLVADLVGSGEGLEEALESGLVRETEPDSAAFRHVLAREALYGSIPWTSRRALHRQIAARLESARAAPGLVAEHWLAAREYEPARLALMASAEAYCAIHAYRDALQAGQRALELWPEGTDEAGRLELLDRLGECSQLSGDLSQAILMWREAADAHRRAGSLSQAARVERRLASVYELQGAWEPAMATRQAAAEAFAADGLPGEAAAERLLAAAHLRSAASFHAALALLETASTEAERAGRLDIQARTLGLEGNVLARLGQGTEGLERVRAGLALALEHSLTGPATEIYQRLADTLEHAGDYAGAQAAYGTAAEFCQTHEATTTAQLCLACLTIVLRLTGDWGRAATLSRAVLASAESTAHARAVASGVLGSLHVLRGEARPARPLLLQSAALAQKIELAAMELDSTWGLAMLDDLTGAPEAAIARCQSLLQRWERTEERHYVVPALYWTAAFCAEHNAVDEVRACAAGLGRIATATGQPEASAALAHALGEMALLEGDTVAAASQFDRAATLLRDRPLPFERAQSLRRAGAALLRAGERDAGVDRLISAYRAARQLGARSLATRVSQDLSAQGEPVDRRVGRRAAGNVQRAGLSRRELEVVQLVAAGRTNREIAQELFLSTRTVDMHVSNILVKLDCRSRADATRRAGELGLLRRATEHG